jgi:chromate transporter
MLAAAGRLGRPTLAQMGWFFTKAALLTFGGAYAVLPYVCRARSSTTAGSARRR